MGTKRTRGAGGQGATPLLLVGDHPSLQSGLARILRDLATRIATDPATKVTFRVAVLGKGGWGQRRDFPFPCYTVAHEPATEWGQSGALKLAWEDWAQGEHGAILTIWDASRLLWFAQPGYCGDGNLRGWLEGDRFQRWGYFPIDATGPRDRLTIMARDTLQGYDRVLAYTRWAAGVVGRTLGIEQVDHLPHGVDMTLFRPRPKSQARRKLGVPGSAWVVGIVATNQARKDWGLALTVCAALKEKVPNLWVWAHTDTLERSWGWNLKALVSDLGLSRYLTLTGVDDAAEWDDDRLAWGYSACDLTLAPGLGEGFGYPIVESLSAGAPCIHGDYAGGAEMLPECWRVKPTGWRLEGLHNCLRPVFRPEDWVAAILAEKERASGPEVARAWAKPYDWQTLWPRWRRWLLAGAQGGELECR